MSEIQVVTRPQAKSAEVNRLRKSGVLPMALIEREGRTVRPIQADGAHIKEVLTSKDGLKIFPLVLDNDRKMKVIVKQIQRNISTRKVTAIVLQEVGLNDKVKMSVPVEFSGTPKAVTKNLASLLTPVATLDFQAQVKDLPDSIQVDLSDMKQNDRILLQDLNLPDGLTPLNSMETVVATTVQLRGMAEFVDDAAAAAEGGEAPAEEAAAAE